MDFSITPHCKSCSSSRLSFLKLPELTVEKHDDELALAKDGWYEGVGSDDDGDDDED